MIIIARINNVQILNGENYWRFRFAIELIDSKGDSEIFRFKIEQGIGSLTELKEKHYNTHAPISIHVMRSNEAQQMSVLKGESENTAYPIHCFCSNMDGDQYTIIDVIKNQKTRDVSDWNQEDASVRRAEALFSTLVSDRMKEINEENEHQRAYLERLCKDIHNFSLTKYFIREALTVMNADEVIDSLIEYTKAMQTEDSNISEHS